MTLTPDQARQLARALLRDDDEPRHARHIPESIGRYRIVRHIGTGGMGEVYEAEQDNPRRRVALKVGRFRIKHAQTLIEGELDAAREVLSEFRVPPESPLVRTKMRSAPR
jgi:serine/threonine protein kinase